jgi:acetylornithine deacetylase
MVAARPRRRSTSPSPTTRRSAASACADDRPDLVKRGLKAQACIVGEPTEMQVIVGHKGKKSYRCTMSAASSAIPRSAHLGVNAVEAAAEIVANLKAWPGASATKGPYDQDVRAALHHRPHRRDPGRHRAQHRAEGLHFDFEFRHLPGDDPDKLFAESRPSPKSSSCPRCAPASPTPASTGRS